VAPKPAFSTTSRWNIPTPEDEAVKQGRQRSIPERVWSDTFRLYSEGCGYRRVAARLADLGVWTTRGSVERLIKGLPPYQDGAPSFLR